MTEPLEEIQDRIVERLHAGEEIDREALLAAHPEHAEALRGFLRVLELVEHGPPPVAASSRLGEFQIVRELGRGGMGVVYEAEQLSLKRRVALKVLPPALGHDERLKARFQREAEAAGRLRHPGIVPVISFGDVAGTPFFAMELVDGRSLAAVLSDLREGRDGGVPPAGLARRDWALAIAIAVAEALAYAHAQGIVHRDVKPGNILLDRAGKPRLSDFGLAQDLGLEGLTQSGESFGSPRYMSPEQAFRRKLPVDRRSDIYSLGVTLYEMLTLRFPYEGATSVEYMNELAQGRVVPPRKLDPALPPALEAVLLRALAKDPEERYPDAEAFAEDLRAVLEKRAIAAFESAAPALASQPRRRFWSRRRIVLALAALVVLAGLAAVLEYSDGVRRRRRAEQAQLESTPPGAWADPVAIYRPRAELRRFVARRAPGRYALALDLPPSVGPEQEWSLEVRWSVSLDGKSWRPVGNRPPVGARDVRGDVELAPGSLRVRVDLEDVLGATLQSDSVTIHHRLDSLVLRSPNASIDALGFRDRPEFAQTVFLYDELPADYPQAVSDGQHDAQMRERLTPSAARFLGRSSLGGGAKALRLDLGLLGLSLPVPAAFEATLFRPGEARPFARSRLVCPEGQPKDVLPLVWLRPAASEGHLVWIEGLGVGTQTLDFVLEPMEAEQEVQLLLDLEQGRIRELRVVLESSRKVACENSTFDRYWSGTIDATVPLQSAAETR